MIVVLALKPATASIGTDLDPNKRTQSTRTLNVFGTSTRWCVSHNVVPNSLSTVLPPGAQREFTPSYALYFGNARPSYSHSCLLAALLWSM